VSKKIAVLGAGAIGGAIGAYLVRGNHDVTLIDAWPENVTAIQANGLRVTAQEGDFTVNPHILHLCEVSAQQSRFDVVILCVKSYDTRWASAFIEPYLSTSGFIVSAQNGINEETIADVVGWSRVVGCVVTIGAGMYEPGHVERTNNFDRPCFILGEPSGLVSQRVKAMAEIMTDAGPAETTTNLWGKRWGKLSANCMGNALCGMTGLTASGFFMNEQSRSVAIMIANELLDVAAAVGVELPSIMGLPADNFRQALSDSTIREQVEQAMIELAGDVGTGRPSLAQDVLKSRKTEVNELNGYVVRKGQELGVATPVNEAVLLLTRKIESGELSPRLENLDLLSDTLDPSGPQISS